ncbi:internalin-J precursor [Lentilactobacillus sunkii]|jgi:hypothetical protein|uniref:Internalin-J n=1 Tax=Lentilactobacillus sunkii TaxID=481719 RepID=A0A1E7XAD9_9LACO|nr:MucBP domain-containing protein [Lentilactobacillus sunkii]OFA10011.1 internalin-J precursor [Lentilactobacillus sunkii]
MKFVDWLKQKLNTFVSPQSRIHGNRRGRRHDYHQRKRWRSPESDTREDPQFADEASEPTKPHYTEPGDEPSNDQVIVPSEPKEVPKIESQVTFFYVDEDNREIKEPDILMGNAGDRLSLQFPSFDKYYLVSIEDFSTYFEDEDQEVTLRYGLKDGLPVIVYFIDIDTGKILHHVQIHSGKLGEPYDVHAKSIEGYRVINNTGQTYGYFDNQTHGVIFYYRRNEWKTVQPVEYYIRLKANHNVFDEPNGQPLKTGLPANVITKVFARIDTTNKQSWLNIGGFEWIKNSNLEPSDPPTNHVIPPITKTSRNPVMLFGTIDFVAGQPIDVFDEPYGTAVGALEDGSRVSIKARIVDDQGLIWYELADQSVIFSEYVRIDE